MHLYLKDGCTGYETDALGGCIKGRAFCCQHQDRPARSALWFQAYPEPLALVLQRAMNKCLRRGSRADCCHRNAGGERTSPPQPPAPDALYNPFYLSITLQEIHLQPHIKADQPPLGPDPDPAGPRLSRAGCRRGPGQGAALHHGAGARLCPGQALGTRTCLSQTGKVSTILHNGHPPGQSSFSDPEILLGCKIQEAVCCSFLSGCLLTPEACGRWDASCAPCPARSPGSQDEQRGLPGHPPPPINPSGHGRNAQHLDPQSPSPPALPFQHFQLPRTPSSGPRRLRGHCGAGTKSDSRWYPPVPTAQPEHPRLSCRAGPSHPASASANPPRQPLRPTGAYPARPLSEPSSALPVHPHG